MSIACSEASSARIEAARLDGSANQRRALQVGLWTQWVILFLTAVSARLDIVRLQWVLLSFAIILGVFGVAFLVTFPKLI